MVGESGRQEADFQEGKRLCLHIGKRHRPPEFKRQLQVGERWSGPPLAGSRALERPHGQELQRSLSCRPMSVLRAGMAGAALLTLLV